MFHQTCTLYRAWVLLHINGRFSTQKCYVFKVIHKINATVYSVAFNTRIIYFFVQSIYKRICTMKTYQSKYYIFELPLYNI